MRFCVILLTFSIFASCKEKVLSGNAADKFYYLEFIDKDNTSLSKATISTLKQRILGRCYYYGAKRNTLQGMNFGDSVNTAESDEYFPEVHCFRSISEYNSSDVDAEKIVITYNQPDHNKFPNFDFRSYKKLGHKEWQSVHNPGNFRFHNANPEGQEKDLSVWMFDLIVMLTFK